MEELSEQGVVVSVSAKEKSLRRANKFLHRKSYEKLQERIVADIKEYLAGNPSSVTMPLAELRSHYLIMTDTATFEAALERLHQAGRLYFKDAEVGMVGYEISLNPQERELATKMEEEFKRAGIHSPLEEDIRNKLGVREEAFQKVMSSLLSRERLFRLSDKVTYHTDAVQAVRNFVVEYIAREGRIKLSDLRDELKFSRKYAQAILEYCDALGLTKRVDDYRILTRLAVGCRFR